jgi:hypothetical protein
MDDEIRRVVFFSAFFFFLCDEVNLAEDGESGSRNEGGCFGCGELETGDGDEWASDDRREEG